MDRLLILSCSQRKRSEGKPLPALERYDGPAFRILRRYLQKVASSSLESYVLSAKHGLIRGNHRIRAYNLRLSPSLAVHLKPQAMSRLEHTLRTKDYSEMFMCLTDPYLQVLDGYRLIIPSGIKVKVASGMFGVKMAQLHDWLYSKAPECFCTTAFTRSKNKTVQIRGVRLSLTPNEAFKIVRKDLLKGREEATRCYAWCVSIDGTAVSPKWLVSKLTGLHVSSFRTDEAMRVLSLLGIEVKRIWKGI